MNRSLGTQKRKDGLEQNKQATIFHRKRQAAEYQKRLNELYNLIYRLISPKTEISN